MKLRPWQYPTSSSSSEYAFSRLNSDSWPGPSCIEKYGWDGNVLPVQHDTTSAVTCQSRKRLPGEMEMFYLYSTTQHQPSPVNHRNACQVRWICSTRIARHNISRHLSITETLARWDGNVLPVQHDTTSAVTCQSRKRLPGETGSFYLYSRTQHQPSPVNHENACQVRREYSTCIARHNISRHLSITEMLARWDGNVLPVQHDTTSAITCQSQKRLPVCSQ